MAEQFYNILTTFGKTKIANASVLGTKVNFATFAIGDGAGAYYNPTEDQLSLKNQVWSGTINNIEVSKENANWIILKVAIPGNVGGFTIRETGVFDTEGNLLAVGKHPETFKPVAENGSTKDINLKMILEVANTSSVNLNIDTAVVLATREEVQQIKSSVDDTVKQLEETNDELKQNTSENMKNMQLNQIGMAIELETLKGATLTGVDANIVTENLVNIDDLTLVNGVYDSSNRKIYIL